MSFGTRSSSFSPRFNTFPLASLVLSARQTRHYLCIPLNGAVYAFSYSELTNCTTSKVITFCISTLHRPSYSKPATATCLLVAYSQILFEVMRLTMIFDATCVNYFPFVTFHFLFFFVKCLSVDILFNRTSVCRDYCQVLIHRKKSKAS